MTVDGQASASYIVMLNIANFQIQAFQFENTTTYEYGNGELLVILPETSWTMLL